MCGYFACVYVYSVCVVPTETRRECWIPEAGAMGGYEQLVRVLRAELSPLVKSKGSELPSYLSWLVSVSWHIPRHNWREGILIETMPS